jgi:hypothetical protein
MTLHELNSRRTDPIAMKSMGNPMPQLHQGDREIVVAPTLSRNLAAMFRHQAVARIT